MAHRSLLIYLAASAVSLAPVPAVAQSIANASFEAASGVPDAPQPAGWWVGGEGYELTLDTAQHVDGRASLRSRRTDPAPFDPRAGQFGVATQRLPRELALGRAVRLTGWIRTERVDQGYAGFWLRVDGAGRVLVLDNMSARGARGTTPWTRYVVELPVDSGATAVLFGALHPGSGTAWFDSLRVEVVGPARPRRVADTPPYVAPPRPAEDFTRLLTDAELAVPDDPAAPAVDTAAASWVRANAHPIRSLGAVDVADLDFLQPLLAGKRVVQLGESGHGVREFDLAKVRVIKYLHEKLGYDVIAFESSLFACDRTGRRAATLTSMELMRGCIFGVWHTEEVLTLFDYIRETQQSDRPLILTGFDVQTSSFAGDRGRPAFLRRMVGVLDSVYARRVYETDSVFFAATRGPAGPEYARRERARLEAFYDSLATWLRPREQELARAFPDDPVAPALARQVAVSMGYFVRQLATGVGTAGIEIRDRGMADNVDFVLDELHPDSKVMVWAHNFHIQHRGFGSDESRPDSARGPRTMGTWVAERHRPELYTIGLFMYRGSGAMNNRVVYQITPPAPGSLEAILHRAPWRYAFVDLARASAGPGTAWMSRPISARQWGTTPETIVPREEYDGILFVDTTWPPQYVGADRRSP